MAIEERAIKRCTRNGVLIQNEKDGYILGATEQRNIDIDKAYLAFSKFLDYLLETGRITLQEREDYEWCDKFRKAMEE